MKKKTLFIFTITILFLSTFYVQAQDEDNLELNGEEIIETPPPETGIDETFTNPEVNPETGTTETEFPESGETIIPIESEANNNEYTETEGNNEEVEMIEPEITPPDKVEETITPPKNENNEGPVVKPPPPVVPKPGIVLAPNDQPPTDGFIVIVEEDLSGKIFATSVLGVVIALLLI